MKKKTKYKSNNDFTLFFVIAVLLCLCSALYFSYRFYESFFNSLTKHETPIATITFKKRVAQRKFADRVVWDRLKQSSPVYNGDTIRTAINSEATLNFQNGASLELQENTLAQFFAKDDGSFLANLAGGSFTANAMEEGSSLQVSSSMGVLDIQEGSSLYMQEGGGNVTLDVLNGSARLENGESVFEGQSISLEEDGYSLLPLTVLSPSQNAKILYSTLAKDGSYPVRFLWKKTEEMGDIVLTVSSDIGFTKGLQKFVLKNVTEKTVKLQDGSYYWKFENDSGALLVRGKLQLLKTNPPAIKSPLNNSTYEYSTTLPDIRFSWSDVQEARTYYVTVSKNKDLSDPLFERPCMTASMSVSSLEEGTYYWQVVPSFSLRAYGERASSKIQSFKVVKKASTLKKPLLLLPKDENVINISSVKQVRFSWQQDKEARSYKIVVSQNNDLRSPLIEETVTNSFFAYKDVLKNGKYYWNVTAVDDLGATNTSAVNSFFVEQTNVEQRTVFPPDKYSIWSQVLTNVNFTWKTSIPENLRFQISRDESFSSVIYDLQKPHDVISGIKLKDGTYYWRIKSNTESAEYVTKPKMFTVVPNLEKAHFTSPRESSPVIEKDGKPYTFSWENVLDAEYYNVAMFAPQSTNPLFSKENVTQNSVTFPIQNLPLGQYIFVLQSYKPESTKGTKRQGTISEIAFVLKEPEVVETKKLPPFNAPSNPRTDRALYDVNALKSKQSISFYWNQVSGANAYIVTIKDAKGKTVHTRTVTTNQYDLKDLTMLSKGKFNWTVKAVSRNARSGVILRNGNETGSAFTIDFNMTGTKLKDTGVLYGQ